MESLFKVVKINNRNKIGNLKSEAHSSVKSTKYFPIHLIEGREMIFKPLSKTKPMTTPLFAYSEVYWSYIINKYFDSRTPRYYLAASEGMDEEQPKYYNQGVLVEKITKGNEQLTNIYDIFANNPEECVDIKDYVNYCMMNYDYTDILSSSFVVNNKEIGENLAYQILLSILRQDQNFHYENINFFDEGKVVAPPIDFEFSTPFLYPDQEKYYNREQEKYFDGLNLKYEEEMIEKLLKQSGLLKSGTVKRNISSIVKKYPHVVVKFMDKLSDLIEDLPSIVIDDPDNYVGALNSDYWEVGYALYKENDSEKYEKLKKEILLKDIDKQQTFDRITNDVTRFSKFYYSILKKYMIAYVNGVEDLENLTIKEILDSTGIKSEEDLENAEIKKYASKKKGR